MWVKATTNCLDFCTLSYESIFHSNSTTNGKKKKEQNHSEISYEVYFQKMTLSLLYSISCFSLRNKIHHSTTQFCQKFLSPFACVRKCWEKNRLFIRNYFHCESENGTPGSLAGKDVYFYGMFPNEEYLDPENIQRFLLFLLLLMHCKYV